MTLESADIETDLYYVDGIRVMKRAVVSYDDNGQPKGATMGFWVCSASPDVDGAADEIARCLNRLPKAEAILIDVAGKLRDARDHWDEVGNLDGFDAVWPLGDAIEEWMLG